MQSEVTQMVARHHVIHCSVGVC